MRDINVFTIVLLLFFLVGCQTTGQAYLGGGGEVLFDMERSVSGNDVTLSLTSALTGQDTLVVVVERLPAGTTFSQSTFSVTPSLLNDDRSVAMWIVSPSEQRLPQFQIPAGIPSTISYTYSGSSLTCSAIEGKYGVAEGTDTPYENVVGCANGDGDEPIVTCVECPAVMADCAEGDVYVETTCEECAHCEAGARGGISPIAALTSAIIQFKTDNSIAELTAAIILFKNSI